MAALASIPRPELQSESLLSRVELKEVEKNPPLAMFRVENSEAIENKWGPGALVRVRNEAADAAERDVYFLVTHSDLLPSCWLSSLQRVNLHSHSGTPLRGIPREWVRYVLVDSRRCTTLVQLTQQAVNTMLATGVATRAVTTAAEGMRATHVMGTSALTGRPVRIVSVAGETLKLDRALNRNSENGLLVCEEGSLLAVANYPNTHYSLAEIVSDFQKERMWQIRCRSIAFISNNSLPN